MKGFAVYLTPRSQTVLVKRLPALRMTWFKSLWMHQARPVPPMPDHYAESLSSIDDDRLIDKLCRTSHDKSIWVRKVIADADHKGKNQSFFPCLLFVKSKWMIHPMTTWISLGFGLQKFSFSARPFVDLLTKPRFILLVGQNVRAIGYTPQLEDMLINRLTGNHRQIEIAVVGWLTRVHPGLSGLDRNSPLPFFQRQIGNPDFRFLESCPSLPPGALCVLWRSPPSGKSHHPG